MMRNVLCRSGFLGLSTRLSHLPLSSVLATEVGGADGSWVGRAEAGGEKEVRLTGSSGVERVAEAISWPHQVGGRLDTAAYSQAYHTVTYSSQTCPPLLCGYVHQVGGLGIYKFTKGDRYYV